jgi:hypothetical protein
MWREDSSGNLEGGRPLLGASTRGLVRYSRTRDVEACIVNYRQTVRDNDSAIDCNRELAIGPQTELYLIIVSGSVQSKRPHVSFLSHPPPPVCDNIVSGDDT